MLGVQATRVVVISPGEYFEGMLGDVEQLGLNHVAYGVGDQWWLDIAPASVTKASALAQIAERCGIAPSHLFAAGDGRNDIDMLRWAGRAGVSVAMGQALPQVQQAATHVTAAVGAGGLALALRSRFPRVVR